MQSLSSMPIKQIPAAMSIKNDDFKIYNKLPYKSLVPLPYRLSPCHTERSEVSHNAESTTESKRDFSLSLKMTRGRRKAQNDKKEEELQNDKQGTI
ncbi:hypothetical protein [Helicobacter fennelliae]|uniref:hypothetical protein n=1 Tax=Helicobacter fennelliae TaxID=215 RepID=UPI000DF9373F|nr:hypothetical protein [Helicobacter fennelliae]STQ84206.1 Uncharacterised protein [Helicobacter fennelliae]